MWLIFGIGAIISALINVYRSSKNKSSKWFRFISLSLTALTVCATYSAEAQRVIVEDWSGLIDVMPSMSTMLWMCCIASIIINSISLFKGGE